MTVRDCNGIKTFIIDVALYEHFGYAVIYITIEENFITILLKMMENESKIKNTHYGGK